MRHTVGELKIAVGRNGSDRARRYAEFAFQAGIKLDGLVIGRGLGVDQNSSQDDEVAELGVDNIAVNAHAAQAGSHGNRLVPDNPDLAWKVVLLHRKARRGIHRSNATFLQGGDYLTGDFIGVIIGAVELQVRGRSGRAASRAPSCTPRCSTRSS